MKFEHVPLRFPRNLFDKIKAQAGREAPLEACGYAAGVDGEVREVFPMRNADQSSEHFSLDPEDQFAVLGKVRERDLELIAVYHTHPETPARMSAEDTRLANDPEMIYIIYSLATGDMKAFAVDENKSVSEVSLEVTG